MTTVILFVLGAIVGSFLNVVALRWNVKDFGGRSRCLSCQRRLKWYELVPILSFILLCAKCRTCSGTISLQYLLVEIWTGLIFVTVPPMLIALFCLYVVITLYDLKYKIIPDGLVYPSILLALIGAYFWPLTAYTVLDWLTGPIIFVFFGAVWLFSHGRAMGFGDAKLGLSVGLTLGAVYGFSGIILAFWMGAFCSLSYLFLNKVGFLEGHKKLTMKSEMPFAPFIVLGAWISLMFHFNILHVASF